MMSTAMSTSRIVKPRFSGRWVGCSPHVWLLQGPGGGPGRFEGLALAAPLRSIVVRDAVGRHFAASPRTPSVCRPRFRAVRDWPKRGFSPRGSNRCRRAPSRCPEARRAPC